MCLAFMQSEHMKKLLFPIYSLFFFLWTLDARKDGRGRGGHQGGGRAVRRRGAGQGWGAPVDEVCWQPAWWRHGQATAGRARQLLAAAADRARSCRGWQRRAEQLEKGGGEEHGGYRLLKNEEAPDGLAWYKFLAADGERRGREWRGGCWSWT